MTRYSSLNWASHLEAAEYGQGLHDAISQFLRCCLLRWLEYLSASNELATAAVSLSRALSAVTVSAYPTPFVPSNAVQLEQNWADEESAFGQLGPLLQDSRQFVLMMFDCINEVPSEVHRSALMWLPESSLLRQYYSQDDGPPCIIKGLSNSWGATEQVYGVTGGVASVAFSPDGVRVACVLDDDTGGIWNTQTGEEEAGFCDSPVQSVAFLPDGVRVLSGTRSGHFLVWNVQTGDIELQVQTDAGVFARPVLSRDGRRIASRSGENKVQVWDAETGSEELRLDVYRVEEVAFSHDCTRIAARTNTFIGVWNAQSGTEELVIYLDTRVAISYDKNQECFYR